MTIFFTFPWLSEPSAGGAALERYSPLRDGASLLVESYDADGRLVSTGDPSGTQRLAEAPPPGDPP